jgi:hydrogenase small subunit
VEANADKVGAVVAGVVGAAVVAHAAVSAIQKASNKSPSN